MTGFGVGHGQWSGGRVDVQVAAVNHRSCQIQIRSDLRDVALEDQVRKMVRDALQRGSVTVQITVHYEQSAMLDSEALADLWRHLQATAQALSAPTPRLELLLSHLPRRAAAVDEAGMTAAISAALGEALEVCQRNRALEGAAIADDLRQRAAALREIHGQLAERAPQRLPAWRDALRARIDEVLANGLDDEALARECALQADRIDVSEELTRLLSHCERLDELLADPAQHSSTAAQAVGRPLEFLVQELGREINTTGAKANDVQLTALVLAAKNILEQVREQAANIL